LQIDRCADLRRRNVGLKLNLFVGAGDFEAGRGIFGDVKLALEQLLLVQVGSGDRRESPPALKKKSPESPNP
jgi:hypothetical protein